MSSLAVEPTAYGKVGKGQREHSDMHMLSGFQTPSLSRQESQQTTEIGKP